MKKILIAVMVAAVLLVTPLLAACNQTEKTDAIPRWGEESYSYNITKADFVKRNTFNDEVYVEEPYAGGYEINAESKDELVPEDVAGTFTSQIKPSKDESRYTYTTGQVLYVQYKTEDIEALDCSEEVKAGLERLTVAADAAENPFDKHEGLVTLKSTTDTEVVFKREASQSPISSKQEVDGFYLGKQHQQISNYTVSTVYNLEESKVTVTYDDRTDDKEGTAEERQLKYSAAANVIDANQLLLYTRSLEKTSTKFQDSVAVQVYQPLNNSLYTANFLFTYTVNTTLVAADGSDVYVKLTGVSVIVDGTSLLTQLSLPDTINAEDAALDEITIGGTTLNKYTQVRFRSGIYSYRMAAIDADILDAVTVKPNVEEEE